ncbi:MAG: hypothetical protein AAFY76_11165 [Cyanobacteria bacterium J06649_11]
MTDYRMKWLKLKQKFHLSFGVKHKIHRSLVFFSLIFTTLLTIGLVWFFNDRPPVIIILEVLLLASIAVINIDSLVRVTKRTPRFKSLKNKLKKYLKAKKNDQGNDSKILRVLLPLVVSKHNGMTFGEANHNLIIFNEIFDLVTEEEKDFLYDVWEVYTNKYEEQLILDRTSNSDELKLKRRVRNKIEKDLTKIVYKYCIQS